MSKFEINDQLNSKLKKLERFLKQNHQFNKALQLNEYKQMLSGQLLATKKLHALLHGAVNSQSNPKLDSLEKFWMGYHNNAKKISQSKFISINRLIELLNSLPSAKHCNFKKSEQDDEWLTLFYSLKQQSGWGDKTAALFIKNLIDIHKSNDQSLHFIKDFEAPKSQLSLFLPVDRVIIQIFNGLEQQGIYKGYCNFSGINQCLHSYMESSKSTDLLIWDDLWFWGFITQKVADKKRSTIWNPAKYCNLLFAPIDQMNSVEKLCTSEFIPLVTGA